MSFFTKHGNTKFVGDWKIGDTEYPLLQTVKPILDAGVFSIKTTPEDEPITGAITLQAGTGCSFVLDTESKTITFNATGTEVTLPVYTLSTQEGTIVLKKDGVNSSSVTLTVEELPVSTNIAADAASDEKIVTPRAVKDFVDANAGLKNFTVTDGTTTINATKITIGDGLEVVAGESGEAVIQRKRRSSIEFTSANLSSNKLTVTDCQVGDFVVVDADGVMVIPVIQQVDADVQIDFTDWTITGTWKVIFR